MSKFKVGDKVICINADGMNSYVVKDGEYTVAKLHHADSTLISLIEVGNDMPIFDWRFKLKEKMIDFTKPIQTREGKKVTIFTTSATGKFPVIGQVEDEDGILKWMSNGDYYSDGSECAYDLKNAPQELVRWINIYRGSSGITTSSHKTRKEADGFSRTDRIGCNRIVFKEGQFDEEVTK